MKKAGFGQVGWRVGGFSIRMATLLLAVGSFLAPAAFGEQNNGQGPQVPIGGGPLAPVDPGLPGGFDPCNPPQLPPGIWTPSIARGRLRETCNGVLQPIANKPIEVVFHTQYQAPACNGGPILPPVFTDTSVQFDETDANGEFEVEFDGGSENDLFVTKKVKIIVYDDTMTVPIWETIYYSAGAGQVYDIYEDVTAACPTQGTRIRIVSPSGDGAFNAELFVNGELYPVRSNPNGFITIDPPLNAGDSLVARALVHENKSHRDSHNQGSNQNWNYRAYITSLPLEYDANGDNVHYTPTEVTDPNGAYELRLNRDASYLGLHLVGSIEWDASPAELSSFGVKMRQASRYLFNATDGQMLIERVDVFDDHHGWGAADFRVYADASLRANVDWPSDGFWRDDDLCCWRESRMHMSRSNDHPVYIHEFGHYGMKLGDEYEDDGGDHCAAGVGGSNPDFDGGGSKASCMMYEEWNYTKICSRHAANPHQKGTHQGDEDCWTTLKRNFTAAAPGPNGAPRWRINTPTDRGIIVGGLPGIPVSDWEALVETHDFNNSDLCQPVQFQWASNNGFAAGARVFSKDASGRMIIQGTTDATGVIKPFQDNVKTVAGLHVGDTIGAMWYQYAGGGFQQFSKKKTFTDSECMSAMVVLAVAPGQAPPSPQEQMVEGASLPFTLAAQLEPGAAIGEAVVRVRAGAELDDAPVVRLSIDHESTAREVAMSLDDASGDWLGDVSGLADQFTVVAEVEAEDVNGATAAIVTQATFTGAVEDDDSELVSADGSVKLGIPLGAFAEPTQISIGGSIAPLPDDFPGRIVVGPIAVKTNGAEPAMPATIRFPLPFDNEEAMLNQLDPSLLIVLAFDESTGLWSEVESTFHHGELAVESEVGQFGAFVLLERGIVDSNHGPEAAPGAGVGDAGDGTPGSDAAASADCGTGTCGGGMAFASPLMLALLGARRRRRGVRNARRRP